MPERGVDSARSGNERAMWTCKRWTRRAARSLPAGLGDPADRPRRVRVVLDGPRVTVLSSATLALIAAEDAAEMRRG